MDDGGISVTGLTIGGAALTTIGGLVGAWIKSRANSRRIEPQPLEIRTSPDYAIKRENDDDHTNIFARLSEHDKKIAALEEQGRNTVGWLKRIDAAVDALPERIFRMINK